MWVIYCRWKFKTSFLIAHFIYSNRIFANIYTLDKQVFKDLDFLGWYTTGYRPSEQDIKVHKQICDINECPIMLQLSPQSRNFDVRICYFPMLKEVVMNNLVYFFPIRIYTAIASKNIRINNWYCARRSDHVVCQFIVYIGNGRSRTHWCWSCSSYVNTWKWWKISW